MGAIFPAGRAIARTAFEPPAPQHAPVPLRGACSPRIVAFVDRSPEGANAAWRAALVARDRGVPLHLLALQPLHADLAAAGAMAEALAADVRNRLGLEVSSQALAGTREHEGVATARDASLLVVPPSRAAALLGGSRDAQVLRMLRLAARPLLVVRQPAYSSYRRVLAAVELDLGACALIAAAHALSRDPRMKVLHVLDTVHEETMRLADVPERSIHAQRERDALRARRVLEDLIASAGAGDDGVQAVIAFGHAGHRVIEQQLATRADLLVVGKRPRHPLVDAVRGCIAQRALRAASADVLVLPMARRAPAALWQPPDFAWGRSP